MDVSNRKCRLRRSCSCTHYSLKLGSREQSCHIDGNLVAIKLCQSNKLLSKDSS